VARTAADLAGHDRIEKEDLDLAASFRVLDLEPTVDPREFLPVAATASYPPRRPDA
jgi:predicted ATPase with chaperone activity